MEGSGSELERSQFRIMEPGSELRRGPLPNYGWSGPELWRNGFQIINGRVPNIEVGSELWKV